MRYGPAAPTRIRPNSDGAGWLSGAGPVSLDLNDPAMAVQARCRKVVTPFIGVSKDGVTTWGDACAFTMRAVVQVSCFANTAVVAVPDAARRTLDAGHPFTFSSLSAT